jgi:hypothetical protein
MKVITIIYVDFKKHFLLNKVIKVFKKYLFEMIYIYYWRIFIATTSFNIN